MSEPSETPPPCRVAICDDVAAFRTALKIVFRLEPQFAVVGEAGNGREAVTLVTGTEVDVLLLDLSMPIMDGLEALPLIRAASPATKVVVLTGFGSGRLRAEALAAGASRYIEKGASPFELTAVVEQVHAEVAVREPTPAPSPR